MEPVLLILGLTALHLALVAMIDLLESPRPVRIKLGWGALILGLPLLGAILYYRRGGSWAKAPRRPSTARGRTRPGPRGEVGASLAGPASDAER